jgi:poly(A) polymerase
MAACADNIEGLQSLSVERITAEIIKLLGAPDPAPALAAMASTGALAQVLPGAESGALAVLVHLEQSLGIAPDPLRRLAVIGGEPEQALRLSNAQSRALGHITAGLSPVETAYRHGEAAGRDVLLVQSASSGQPIADTALAAITHAANQVFPLKAADLMPALSGPALGKALQEAEARWIASGFTLTKADLLG